MKKGAMITAFVIVLLIGAVFVLGKIDFNRMGKEHAYYRVGEPASIEETKLDSGEVMKRYEYTGPAYKEDGKQIEVDFNAAKKLKQDAYLKLYLKKEHVVTSYDEVQETDIPKKVEFSN